MDAATIDPAAATEGLPRGRQDAAGGELAADAAATMAAAIKTGGGTMPPHHCWGRRGL